MTGCYACGQNFRQSDTPLTCHTTDCEIRTHKQTRYSGVPRSQQSLLWHCSTLGGLGPPVTSRPSHACYSCHHRFRPGTRLLTCLAQGCMNLAHAASRCSGPTAPTAQPLTRRFVLEPKHHQCRQILRVLQWNADGLATKQHELRFRLNDDKIDIYHIQET